MSTWHLICSGIWKECPLVRVTKRTRILPAF
jgi:hypothetical protein